MTRAMDLGRAAYEDFQNRMSRDDPRYAQERAEQEIELAAWKATRAKLSEELNREQFPFVIGTLGVDPAVQEASGVVLRVIDYLWDMGAPPELMRDLLRIGKRLLPE